jgi:excisionase family DNA binding protein
MMSETKPVSFEEVITRLIEDALRSITFRNKRLLTMTEAVEYLSVSDNIIYELIARGDLVPVRLIRRPLFDVNDLDRLIQTRKEKVN